jgi:hypothetical protein
MGHFEIMFPTDLNELLDLLIDGLMRIFIQGIRTFILSTEE